MRIVVDTNIVFSAILNTNSKIGEILLSKPDTIQFYTCNFLDVEIEKHKSKLIKLSKINDYSISEIIRLVYKHITFISEEQIPKKHFDYAHDLLNNIDIGDIPFLALNEYLNGFLWTGDKKLLSGLKGKGYDKIINTNVMINIINHI